MLYSNYRWSIFRSNRIGQRIEVGKLSRGGRGRTSKGKDRDRGRDKDKEWGKGIGLSKYVFEYENK
jgi:hypothetical protein